jgi:hypothetical protein
LVVKLVDTQDLKSCGTEKSVRVRLPPEVRLPTQWFCVKN